MIILTEKGIGDYSYCPTLLLDYDGNTKRVKPAKESAAMTQIIEALESGERNRYVYIEDSQNDRNAYPHTGESFWIQIIASDKGGVLLSLKRMVLKPVLSDEPTLYVLREQNYSPRTEEQERVEDFVLNILFAWIKQQIPPTWKLSVTNRYLQGEKLDKTIQSLEEEVFEEAQDWLSAALDFAMDPRPIPTPDRCYSCWWRNCQYRQIQPAVGKRYPKAGKPLITALD